MLPSEQIYIGLIFVVPGFLHALGLYLFLTTPITKLAYNQKLYYINISLCTLGKCVLKITYKTLTALHVSERITFKIWTLDTGALFFCYILFLVVLTVDRFLEIYLNITYPLWSTRKSTLVLVTLSWCIMAATWIALCFLEDSRAEMVVVLYFWPCSESLFLIVAIFVYSYLFVKIRQNRRKLVPLSNYENTTETNLQHQDYEKPKVKEAKKNNRNDMTIGSDNAIHDEAEGRGQYGNGDKIVGYTDNYSVSAMTSRQKSVKKLLYSQNQRRRRRFYIPTLLVATFVMFWVVPDMTDFGMTVSGQSVKYSYMIIPLNILICIAMSSDAVIYMLLVVELRKRLKKIFQT